MRTADTMQELADKLAIRELTARYNFSFDSGDAEGYADCWTEDGRMIHENGEIHGGRDEFVESCRRYDRQVIHTTTDALIELDGDRATQLCTLVVYTRNPDRTANEFFMTGRYRDELQRTPDGWKFHRRRTENDLVTARLADKLGV